MSNSVPSRSNACQRKQPFRSTNDFHVARRSTTLSQTAWRLPRSSSALHAECNRRPFTLDGRRRLAGVEAKKGSHPELTGTTRALWEAGQGAANAHVEVLDVLPHDVEGGGANGVGSQVLLLHMGLDLDDARRLRAQHERVRSRANAFWTGRAIREPPSNATGLACFDSAVSLLKMSPSSKMAARRPVTLRPSKTEARSVSQTPQSAM